MFAAIGADFNWAFQLWWQGIGLVTNEDHLFLVAVLHHQLVPSRAMELVSGSIQVLPGRKLRTWSEQLSH